MTRLSVRTLLLGLLIGVASHRAQAQVDVDVSIGGFYDELAPYGRWVDCTYGQCWVPGGVSADWQPYTNGQWIYTTYGWTWASNDPWGASPYHYGSWAPIPGYGWGWVPGTIWAPAWVTWSYNANYVGWAPLPPSVVIGGSGYAGSAVVLSPARYVFVPTNRFVGVNVASVRVPTLQSETIFRQTTQITRFSVAGGIVRNTAIPMATIEHAGGSRVETQNISVAKTAPRSFAVHGNGSLPVAAPANEIKAAVSGRPQPAASAAKTEQRGVASKAGENPARPPQPNHEAAAPVAAQPRAKSDASRAAVAAKPADQREGAPAPVKHPQEKAVPQNEAPKPPVAARSAAKHEPAPPPGKRPQEKTAPQGEAPRQPVAARPAEKHQAAPPPVKHPEQPGAKPAQAPRPASDHAAEPAKPSGESKKPDAEKPPAPKQGDKDKEDKPGN
jgi:hypothetical protein